MSDKENSTENGDSAAQRQLIAAYLSSAREEVAVLSPTGLRLLEMTIQSLTTGVTASVIEQQPQSLS
ncbi:MAG TPA: hypothetical protein VH206_11195 [Xanthobacteraceae bacterium]|nr:hypothetical protein [Xanthobacteraceae bacterium]